MSPSQTSTDCQWQARRKPSHCSAKPVASQGHAPEVFFRNGNTSASFVRVFFQTYKLSAKYCIGGPFKNIIWYISDSTYVHFMGQYLEKNIFPCIIKRYHILKIYLISEHCWFYTLPLPGSQVCRQSGPISSTHRSANYLGEKKTGIRGPDLMTADLVDCEDSKDKAKR